MNSNGYEAMCAVQALAVLLPVIGAAAAGFLLGAAFVFGMFR
jgi:hypothetical protein